jgi:hypothetical protein
MMQTRRLYLALGIGLILGGCESTGPGDNGQPPVLPLEESMVFDTESFPSAQPAAVDGIGLQVAPGLNHTAAALGVIGINLAVVTITAVPRLTWAALASRPAVFEDGQWHWRGSTTVFGVNYSGDLAGYLDAGDVVAEVRITSPGVSDFLWYDGRAPIGGNSGQWRIYDANQPSSQVVVGTIDWAHPGADVWTLTFTAVAGANPGDNLVYTVDGDARSVTWLDASEAKTYGISWDAITGEGSIMAAFYNGGVKACWDAALQDVACP